MKFKQLQNLNMCRFTNTYRETHRHLFIYEYPDIVLLDHTPVDCLSTATRHKINSTPGRMISGVLKYELTSVHRF